MKKLLLFAFILLLALPVLAANPAKKVVTFGLNQQNSWSDTYFSASNIQHTNITTDTAKDGEVVLAFVTPSVQTDWDDLTGWTEEGGGGGGADSLISPASQLYMWSTTVNQRTTIYDANWAAPALSANFALFHLIKFDGLSASQETGAVAGCSTTFDDGSRGHQINFRTDGAFLNMFAGNGLGVYTKTATISRYDASRWHICGFYNPNANNGTIAVSSGREIATGLTTFNKALIGADGYIELYEIKRLQDGNTATRRAWTKYFNSVTPWTMELATLETVPSNAVFDAGADKKWSSLSWNATTGNSTAITFEVRSSSTIVGVTLEAYQRLFNSGDKIINQKRYVQVRIQLSAASSGRYTPILTSLKLEAVPTSLASMGGPKKRQGVRTR